MPNEILYERLQSFTPEYYDFVMSDFTEVVGAEAQSYYNWSEDTRQAFENMLFLNITLFLNRIEFIEALISECNLSVTDAITIVNTTLAKLPPEMVQAQQEATIALTQNNDEPVAEKDRFGYTSTIPLQKLSVYLYVKATPSIDRLCNKYGITDEDIIAQSHTLLGDIILGFYKIEDTVPLLQQELGIDAKTAALLGVDVLDFLTPLSDPNFVVPTEETVETNTPTTDDLSTAIATPYQPEYFQVAAPAPTPSITTDAIQKFNAARAQMLAETSTPEMRTMASDMARSPERTNYEPVATKDEPTYTSQQPEVRTPLSGLPAYTNAHTPTAAPTPAIHEPARWS